MLDDLQARYAGQMKIIAVSMDRDIVEAESFYNSKSIQSLGLYHDESLSMASKLGVDGLPVSVFYSASGREIARISGDVDWNDPIIDAFLAEIYDFGG